MSCDYCGLGYSGHRDDCPVTTIAALEARALAAEAALATVRDVLDDGVQGAMIAGDGTVAGDVAARIHEMADACFNTIADAEARGRQHGLLAAAMLAEASIAEAAVIQRGETNATGYAYWEGIMDEDESLLGDLAVLATESA